LLLVLLAAGQDHRRARALGKARQREDPHLDLVALVLGGKLTGPADGASLMVNQHDR